MANIDLQKELLHYRAALNGNAEALIALDLLEDYDFEAEEALYAAWQRYTGIDQQERGSTIDEVKKAVEKCRDIICHDPHRQELAAAATISMTLESLVQSTGFPTSFVTAVLMYILKVGIERFCKT